MQRQIFFEKYAFQSLPLYKKLTLQIIDKIKLKIMPSKVLAKDGNYNPEIKNLFV